MKTAFTASALVGLMLMLSPAAADPITELQPFLGEGKIISGNKTGDGVYDGITFGENGEKGSAERLSIEMDGNNLTNLTMEQVVILDPDGTKGTIGRIVVDNSSIPLNLDKEDPKAFFAWILSLNADRLAIEDLNVGSKDLTVTIGTVAAENVRNGYFEELKIENLAVDGTSDEGVPFTVTIDKASMRGVGAAWMLYMRSMALEQASTSSANMSSNLSGEDFAFLDDFKLADHVDQLRLKGFTFSGLKVVSNGADLFNLDSYTGHITDYSGAFPVAGEYTLSGSVNVETIRGLSASNPQAQMGLQMFQAAYGDPVVNFSGSGEQSYSKETRTMVSRMKIIELDRLMKINLYTVFDNYDPADFIEALYDPNDDKTMVTAMKDASVTGLSLKVADLGALDIGFSLAPPGIERNQAALQAAQLAGLGVVQAMQFGVSITGDVAGAISGFVQNGGTLEVKLQDGASLPWAPVQELMANPENQALAMDLLKYVKLEVSASQ